VNPDIGDELVYGIAAPRCWESHTNGNQKSPRYTPLSILAALARTPKASDVISIARIVRPGDLTKGKASRPRLVATASAAVSR
jgi:hypothetical protein